MVRNSSPDLEGHIVPLPEAFNQAALGAIDRQIDTAIASNPETLTIEMSLIQAVDSAALNWLLAVQTRLAGLGIQMVIHNPSALATDVLVATRMEHRFQIVTPARRGESVDA